MKIKIYADGADYKQMSDLCKNSLIKGFTTNPTLMKKNNIKDYKKFALKVLNKIKHIYRFDLYEKIFNCIYFYSS